MSPYKKFIFAPLFLIAITLTLFFYSKILPNYIGVFFGNWGGLYEFTLLALPLLAASLMFCLFITFTQDFKSALILSIGAAATPFAFLDLKLAVVIAIGLLISLNFAYFNLETNLKTYIHFQPKILISGPIKMLNVFLLLTLSAGFYLHSNSIIQKEGFKIPDQLINWAVDFSVASSGMNFKGDKQYLAQALTPEQLELLKQNPQILQQYGLKPEDLDALTAPKPQATTKPNQEESTAQVISLPSGNIKTVLKNQINSMINQTLKPYLFLIPIFLTFMFYSLASLVLWFFSLFLPLIISSIFSLFEQTRFVKYETEMREVKKIVI